MVELLVRYQDLRSTYVGFTLIGLLKFNVGLFLVDWVGSDTFPYLKSIFVGWVIRSGSGTYKTEKQRARKTLHTWFLFAVTKDRTVYKELTKLNTMYMIKITSQQERHDEHT